MAGISASEMLRRLESFNPIDAARTAVAENTDKVADTLRDQLLHGFDGTGNKMRPYANDAYARKKYAQNPLAGYGIRDQHKTGETYKEIVIKAGATGIEATSTSKAAPFVLKRDGEKVLQFSQNSMILMRTTFIHDALFQQFADALNNR